jgi:hypothetical protein
VRVRLTLELGELCRAAVEALREEGERGAGVTRAGDERPVLLRGEAEAVDRGERVLERVRAQDDRERVGAALLVQRAEALRQAFLRGVQRDACDAQLPRDGRALAGHGVGAGAHLGGAALRGPDLRLQRVELEHGRARSRRQRIVRVAELGGPAGRLRA